MNWKEIKEKYPKAFDLWEDYSWWFQYWDDKAHHIEGIGVEHNDIRGLYDFFDEKKIYIELSIDYEEEPKHKLLVGYEVLSPIDFSHDTGIREHATRAEAESEAFTKAFEILELTNNKKK